jgi:methyl-accepting chemotaxis protein
MGFFKYHGPWAPGVRLFRKQQFATKAGIISAMFLIPLAVLGWSYYQDKAAAIDFSAKERLGVQYARASMGLLRAAQSHRWLEVQALSAGKPGAPSQDARSGTMVEAEARVQTELAKVSAMEARLGTELGTGAAFAAMKSAVVPPGHGERKAAAALELHGRFIDAVLALQGQATDGSNLTLDPDIDSYYVMDSGLFRLPPMLELAARMQAAGALMAASPQAGAELVRVVGDAAPVFAYHQDNVKSGLDKAFAANAALKSLVKPNETLAAGEAYVGAVRNTLLGTGESKAQPEALSAQAQGLIEAQTAVTDSLLTALDGLLEARVGAMRTQRAWATTAVVVSLSLAIYLFYSFFLVTRGGLHEVRRHLEAMTSGDLTSQPKPWGSDEAAHLMVSLAEMQAALREIVSQVRWASDSLVHSSAEIASGAMDLSSRTEEASANLQSSASAMEQVSSVVKSTASGAREAATLASNNAEVAVRGGEIIGTMVATMRDIHASSSKIGDIIGTIDGIAFQTNILALNAAVEAARAGDSGRGFAVVASEVRALAQRSASAAREIKTLIGVSVDQVDSGARVVQRAGTTMGELVESARRVNVLLGEIAVGANEQAEGVSQTTASVHELDALTQANAALVEQTAAAASSLKEAASGLATKVAVFKLPAMA